MAIKLLFKNVLELTFSTSKINKTAPTEFGTHGYINKLNLGRPNRNGVLISQLTISKSREFYIFVYNIIS